MNIFWIFWRNWNFDLWCFFFFWKIWKSWIFEGIWKNLIDEFFFFFFENFGNLEFFHGIEIFDWWFFFFEKFRNLEFFQGIENFEFFFFFWKKPKKYEPNALSPKAFFENFVFFFLRFVHYQKKVKKMKMMME